MGRCEGRLPLAQVNPEALKLARKLRKSDFDMVEHYAKQVNQKKLAVAAILKWENAERTEFVQRGS